MFGVGLFDHPVGATAPNVSTPEHKALATRLSQEGTVLLRNQGGELPLPTSRKVAVIGYSADAGAQYAGGGSANVTPSGTPISPLAGITARAGAANVTYAKGPGGPLPVLPSDRLTGGGFTGNYYPNGDFTGTPLAVRTDPTLNFGTGSPAQYALPVGGAKSARWEGTLKVNTTGSYHFSARVNGTIKVYINNQQLIDTSTSALTVATGEGAIALTAGQPATIRVDYTSVSFPQFGVLFAQVVLGAQT